MNREKYIKDCCMGCGLCHSVDNIRLQKDKKGFVKPQECKSKVFEKICPIFKYMDETFQFLLWGEYVSVYEGYAANGDIRFKASSGGALTAISIYLLQSGLVDGIIHVGAASSNPMETETFVSRTIEEVLQHMGSRYSISSPLLNLLTIIKPGETYAFIGKPCDVAAVQRYRQVNPQVEKQIKICLSFFCAGIPSEEINEQLLNVMGTTKNRVKEFQYRGNGWPGYATAIDNDGTVHQISYQDAWGKYLGRDVNRICRYCMDGIGEFADIACADFWYLNDGKPDFSEHEGRNIIICRSMFAEDVVRQASVKGFLISSDCSGIMNEFDKYQPYQFSRRVTMKSRVLALRMFGRFAPKYNKRLLRQASRYATKGMNWSIFKGTIKRILQGKL